MAWGAHSYCPDMKEKIKRIFDLAVSAPLFALLLPVMAAVALAIALSDGMPVLFRHVRPGYKARPFTMLKFRTMAEIRDAQGNLLSDEARLTRTGRFIRHLSLDELPQLWNVVRGEMSLVGPRPLLTRYLDRYTPEQARRHDVQPGMTGWTQVNGRNTLGWDEKFKLDVWYVDHCGFFLDLKILLLTIFRVLNRSGIAHAGYETMPEFLGAVDSSAPRRAGPP